MKCGECKWHFDLIGVTEKIGVKNCLAQPTEFAAAILSTEAAECNLPERFEAKSDIP